jgi:hypothetical protein
MLLGACAGAAPEDAPFTHEVAARDTGFAVHRTETLGAEQPPSDTLRVQRLLGDSLAFARVVKLYHRPGRLLVLDGLLSYHLALVELGDGTVRHFGRDGDGPGEFRVPFSASFTDQRSSEVWIYDFQLNRFSLLDLSGTEPTLRRTTGGPGGIRLLDPVFSGDVVSNVLAPKGTLAVGGREEPQSLRVIDLGTPFDPVLHPSPLARRLLSRTVMSASPDGTSVAIAYQFANRLEIAARDGRHLASARGPREGNPSYRLEGGRFFWNDDNVSLYTGATASEHHVYLLYCGCRFADEQRMTRVHVFDWKGRFVRELAFDRPVGALAVSADDSALFGFVEDTHPSIAEWNPGPFLPPGRTRDRRITARPSPSTIHERGFP